MKLSYDLGARVVTIEAGPVPQAEDPRLPYLHDALQALGRHGDRTGAVLALESGLEAPEVLRQFVDQFDTAGLAVNLEPANLLMNGHDPLAAVRSFGDLGPGHAPYVVALVLVAGGAAAMWFANGRAEGRPAQGRPSTTMPVATGRSA